MSTTVRATGDPAEFKATVFPFPQADPVLNSTLLTNTEDRIRGILHDPCRPADPGGGSEACLFTDLANPTSNKIYAAIGYGPVADFQMYKVGD